MHPEGVDHHKNDADHRDKEHIDGRGNKPLNVAPYLLQLAQSFAAALVFEYLIGQIQRMPDPVRVHFRAQPLHDHVDEIVLKIFRHARHKRHSHRRQQQKPCSPDELPLRVLVILRGIAVDDMTKNQGIEKRKDLIGRGQ